MSRGCTSLPELVTSVVAARPSASEAALGNLIGSAILNIRALLGGTALVPVPPEGRPAGHPGDAGRGGGAAGPRRARGRCIRRERGLMLGRYVDGLEVLVAIV